jgi:DNA-binding SARP family transcriptional activator
VAEAESAAGTIYRLAMNLAVLGPLEVDLDGRPVTIGAAKERALLTVLAIRVRRAASMEEIVDFLWGDDPPRSARQAVQTYVSNLRRHLGSDLIVTIPGGYRLLLDPGLVDSERFERLAVEGQRLAELGRPAESRAAFEAALQLWLGPPLGELTDHVPGSAEAARLNELHAATDEALADVRLGLGQHHEMVGDLEASVARYPFRERRWSQLMLALYRSGRQADALRTCGRLRHLLREELGIEPAPEINALEAAILLQKPDLDWAGAPAEGRADADEGADQHGETSPSALATAVSVRRLVSVLCLSLHNFAAATAGWDPEDVSELLGAFNELARTIVARYRGRIEHGSGETVVAVWGADATAEDQAERAVRAGLELVHSVPAFGDARGIAGLTAAAGAATGIAATAPVAGTTGLVGDVVQTARALAQAAPAGSLLCETPTMTACRAGVTFAEEPYLPPELVGGGGATTRTFRATGTRGDLGLPGAGVGGGPPLVGRAGELALLRGHFQHVIDHAEERVVAIIGPAGVGKSRLAGELRDYLDGGSEPTLWLSGRCLSYGDGVSFYAIAQAVRGQLGLSEDDSADIVEAKLRAGVDHHLREEGERSLVLPALAALLGLPATPLSRDELFAGWRAFLYALSDTGPVVLVIDDAEWADDGLIEFLSCIVDWAGHHRVFVLLCARPPLAEVRRELLARPNVGVVGLAPLDAAATYELVNALIPECPEQLSASLNEKAQGLPLYLTELVRSLAGQGVLADRGHGTWAVVRPFDEVELPTSLTALLAARLDALAGAQRSLVNATSVFSGAFSPEAAATVGEINEADTNELLHSLVGAGILALRADRLSPERGQFVFSHPLVRAVAYDLLTRRERKAYHLSAARTLERASETITPDAAGAIAAHRLAAFEASHIDADAGALRADARLAFDRAGDKALEVGATGAAVELYQKAADLALDRATVASCMGKAGWATHLSGRPTLAISILDDAIQAYEEVGDELGAARLVGLQYGPRMDTGRVAEGIPRLRWALQVAEAGRDSELATDLRRRLGSALGLAGELREAQPLLEQAAAEAKSGGLPTVLGYALNSLGLGYEAEGRFAEAEAVWRRCLEVCEANQLGLLMGSPLGNLGGLANREDRLVDALRYHEAAAAHEHRAGNKAQEAISAASVAYTLALGGEADEGAALCERLLLEGLEAAVATHLYEVLFLIAVWRGDPASAASHFDRLEPMRDSSWEAMRIEYRGHQAAMALVAGDAPLALERAESLVVEAAAMGPQWLYRIRAAWVDGVEAALVAGERVRADLMLALLPGADDPGLAPYLQAQRTRFRARRAALEEDAGAASLFSEAADSFSRIGYTYWVARTRLDHAEWLAASGRESPAAKLGREAAAFFGRYGAISWQERSLVTARRCVPPPPLK